MPFYERAMSGSAMRRRARFSLLLVPGGGLNSRISNWPTAVFNSMEPSRTSSAASRWTTQRQRRRIHRPNAGPTSGCFADDQLGLMDHLGIRSSFLWATASAAALPGS